MRRSGNTISFIMEHEKYSYVDALKWLANRYNIEIEETFATDEQRQQQQSADSLYIINNFAQEFFSKTLFETEEGQDIGLSYLKERGFRGRCHKEIQIRLLARTKGCIYQRSHCKTIQPGTIIKDRVGR
ncbi:MAG: CHC2 zinc finger domain-containing protein [Bacteroidota bacterium]